MKWNYDSSTSVFDETTCPHGIKNKHEVMDGYYGQLNVLEGKLHFVIEETNEKIVVDNKKPFFIEPKLKHHLEFIGKTKFRVDFYKII